MNAQHAKELTKQFWNNLVMPAVEEAAKAGKTTCYITRPWLTSCKIMHNAPPMFIRDEWEKDGFKIAILSEYITINWD